MMQRITAALTYVTLAVTALALLPMNTYPQDEEAPYRVPKVNSDVKVDAVLDEQVWEEALRMDLNYEVRPGENVPPPVRTEVLLAYDDTHLYCGFKAHDPDPSKICARICDRDNLWDDDWVVLNLDTFNDQRRSFLFFCNPFGVQADNMEMTGGGSTEWDPIWDSAGRITDQGYTVEMAIPFSSLRFQRTEEDQIWGIDAIRSYPRSVRHHIGLFPRDRNNNCYLCQATKIIGFAGATPGRNVEFDPTFSTVHTEERPEIFEDFGDRESDYDFGLTARWGVTPNLTFNGTVNPDFSQVEADAAQLDINTQFALYYSEMRPFFLEGVDLFGSRLGVVHTRTLADPRWGAKLTGKEGSHGIGVFIAEDDVTNLLFPTSEGTDVTSLDMRSTGAVLRYRRDLSESSTLGMFATNREGSDYHSRLVGLDGDMRFTQKENVMFQVIGTRTRYPYSIAVEFDQPLEEFDGFAYDIYYLHSARDLDWYAVHRRVDPGIRCDLGYRPQVNYKYYEGGWGYTWHNSSDHWWNMLNIGSGYEYEVEDDTGHLLNKGVSVWFDYSGLSQSYAHISGFFGTKTLEGIEFDHRLIGGEAGLYINSSLFVALWTDFGQVIDYGNARQGTQRFTLLPLLDYKLGRHLSLTLKHTYQHLNVDEGRLYTANVTETKGVYQFNKRSFLRAIVQYWYYDRDPELYVSEVDTETRYLLNQILFSYKVNPQTMLFIGYSDFHLGDQDYNLTQVERTVFAKLGYAWTL
jgi:hypothetical protein